jgi:ABC-type multidrug transport system fused ATPase/permease subunit
MLDDVRLHQLAADDLRRVVGLVGQSPHLFHTTVAENLRLARRSASDTDLAEVLGRVGLAEWLAGLPQGLATEVGVDGSRLSGGQRQRLALARALLADFPILILDEPGEHLEPVAADALMADALSVTEGRSILLITHRLAGLEQVDEILFLDGGRVVERGTHAALVGAGGHFARWWWHEQMQLPRPGQSSTIEEARSA